METTSLEKYLSSLRLGRDVLDVMLGGKSAIDTRGGILPTRNEEAAERFIEAYGYRLSDPIQAAEIMGAYQEAIRFIRKYFLKPENPEGLALQIPTLFLELKDIRRLFVYSTEKNIQWMDRTNWACAIIRVMHTVAHLEKDLREDYFPTIQKQVFDRFYRQIHNVDGKIFLGKPDGVTPIELKYFQTKPRKERDSKILKLLHKAENVTEDIYDSVGVRFVAKSKIDCLRILKYLRDHNIVIPANLKASRSRNSLVDPFLYRRVWREARNEIARGDLRSIEEIDAFIERRLVDGEAEKNAALAAGKISKRRQERSANLFSADSYTAIQYTGRQLIKFRHPAYEELKRLRDKLRDVEDVEIRKSLERIDFASLAKEQRFFYPFEVQLMDEWGYGEANSGSAAHSAYKAAQIQVAAIRVLGNLVKGA